MLNSQKVLNHLLNITNHFEPFSSDSGTRDNWWIKNEVIISLDEDGINEKKLLLKEIFTDPFVKTNFPINFIEDQINGIISEASKKSDDERPQFCKEQINQFYTTLKNEIKDWIILIPIENFKIKKIWKFGNVKFYPAHKKYFLRIIQLWKATLEDNPHYTKEEKQALIDQQLEVLVKSSNGFITAFAEVKIKGIVEVAEKEAMKKVRFALNIVKLYNYHYKDSHKQYFGISGEVTRHNLRYTMRYDENNTKNLHPIIEHTGFILPFELDRERLKFMRQKGIRKLETIFKSNNLSDLEKRLLSTIFWYGEAINTDIYYDDKKQTESNEFVYVEYFGLNQKFLKMIIALESILLFDETEPIQNNIAERSAFLISKKYDHRKEIITTIKKFYKMRSKIVHHGESQLKLVDVYQLSWIVQNVIFNLIKLIDKIPLERKEDLQQYIEKLKLS